MNNDQDVFLKELLADFRIEAFEHILAIEDGLLSLEKNKTGEEEKLIIERIFRETHSLKGAARAVNLLDIERLCMCMESIFNSLKKGETRLSLPMFDTFYSALDTLKILLNDFEKKDNGRKNTNLSQIISNLEYVHKSALNHSTAEKDYEKNKVPEKTLMYNNSSEDRPMEKDAETIRIDPKKLINILNQAEEFVVFKSKLEYYKSKLYSISNKTRDESIFPLIDDFTRFQRVFNRMIDELTLDIKSSLLFPFSSLLSIYPKIVRDLSKEYSKDIEITIKGDNIEIDRRILEEIKDPLTHLIRNSIDHGIETPEKRKAKGKSSQGKIIIDISRESSTKVLLKVFDDGAGIDKEKIIKSAIKNSIIDSDSSQTLTENEIFSLIFNSGISSRDFVTDISGRGLGMAIVAEKVSKLGGNIDIQSKKDVGTTFIISLPKILSTFRGIRISVGDQYFAIPSANLEKAIRIKKSDISSVGSKRVISHSGESIAFVNMNDALGIGGEKPNKNFDSYVNVLILTNFQKKIAFAVDKVYNEQEGIVKELGPQLLKVNKISGVIVLGNGKLAPIIDVNELIESTSKSRSFSEISDERSSLQKDELEKKKILVVEDSITVRAMLRNFIESSGYYVKTAVDGLDAYNILQNETFDLVVSDIEMPRMNGFELTYKLRELAQHADLPIVLVTALESIDDQRRGLEAGANAYIVKGSFKNSNLIETIKRLI